MGRNASTSFSAETRSLLTTTASTFAPRSSLGAILFSGTWSAGQKQQTKSKEKGNEQVRIKAKKAGIRQERKEREVINRNPTQPQSLCPVRPRCTCFLLTWALRAVPMTWNLCAEQRK
jgi:hypothetical protein